MAATDKPSIHCFGDDALGEADTVALWQKLRSGECSVRELTEAVIARIEKVDPSLNAMAFRSYERARGAVSHGNGLSGIPFLVKDNTDLAGLPTGHGSAAVARRPAKKDGAYASQLLSTGLNVLGKTNLPEFGFNATTEPAHDEPTRNPWNPEFSSGGSSGGSAALVAAGAVPLAHANDGGGSIRIPAACCGLVGLKPTRERHRMTDQAKQLPINVLSEGVVTRTVRDTALFHAEMETVYANRRLPPIGRVEGPGNRRLRIGLMTDSINGHRTDDDTRQTVEATARLLERNGHIVESVAPPVKPSFPEDFKLYWGFLAFMAEKLGWHAFGRGFRPEKMDGLSKGLSRHYRHNMWRTPTMVARLKRTRHQYAHFFRTYDALISPVLGHTTPRIGYLSPDVPFETLFERLQAYASFTPYFNTAGGPALSMPMGRTADNVPIGVHIAAGHGHERLLLELGFELEAG
jgi:amidase